MSIHVSKPYDNELAKLAYQAVADVPTVEPNDRNRLGYHVWLYLRGELTSLEDAIRQSRSRYKPRTMAFEDVLALVNNGLARLRAAGLLTADNKLGGMAVDQPVDHAVDEAENGMTGQEANA